MTDSEVKALSNAQLEKAIVDIGNHPFAERFVRELNARKESNK